MAMAMVALRVARSTLPRALYLDMARLTTRGLVRSRLLGIRLARTCQADCPGQVSGRAGQDAGGEDDLVAGGVQGDGEAGAVGVGAGDGAGGVGDGGAQYLVGDQQGVDLLVDAAGGAATASSPRHRAPPGDGPRSRKNSSRSGPGPRRRRAWVIADAVGATAASPPSPAVSRPDLRVSQLGEQAPCHQQVDHDPGREVPGTALDPACLLQHRVDHLERHLLRQLAQVTRREPPSGHRHGTGNDTLIHGGAPGDEAVLGGQTSLTGVPLPSHQPTHLDSQATRLTNRPCR